MRTFFFLALVAVVALAASSALLVHAHGHHHHHGHHNHDGDEDHDHHHLHGAFEELLQDDTIPISTKEVKRFPNNEKVKLVTIRFAATDDGYTTSADFACNAEVTRVETLDSTYAPHGWHVVPLTDEQQLKLLQEQQEQPAAVGGDVDKKKTKKKNKNSNVLLRAHTPKELATAGLARDPLSATGHDDAPLHAVAFDLPQQPKKKKKKQNEINGNNNNNNQKDAAANKKKEEDEEEAEHSAAVSAYVHLFRDPRFERLHSGHYPAEEKPTHHPGEEIPLPLSHPQHECHRKGECSVDRIHYRTSSTESFWVPESVTEIVLSCAGQHQKTALVSKTFGDDAVAMDDDHRGNSKKNNKKNKKPYKRLVPPPAIYSVTAPPTVTPLVLAVHPETQARLAQQQASSAVPEVIRLIETGPPDLTYSIVFLSGGYTVADRQMFINNVSALAKVLMDPQMGDRGVDQDTEPNIANIHRSCPFNRYWGFWNVYAVFQASNERGASRPLKGQVVDNNLGCVHPAEIERAVSCDRNIAAALVEVSPAPFKNDPERVVIISIVNTFIYGGSAVYIPGKMHFANFFNGFSLDIAQDKERMLSLTDHEIGHALGNLMDEYSVGVPEPTGRKLRNCQVGSGGPPSGSSLQWADWMTARKGAGSQTAFVAKYGNDFMGGVNFDVLATPEAVCGFTNYYKPNANCMMNRLNDYFMCPVCREEATLQLFKSANFTYDFPRWPFRDQVLLVSETSSDNTLDTSDTVLVHLNRFVAPWNGFKVTASLDLGNGNSGINSTGTALEVVTSRDCPACIVLTPAQFKAMPRGTEVRIEVTIKDDTRNFVLPEKQGQYANQLNQKTFFRVVVVPDAAALLNTSIGGAITFYNYSSKAAYSRELGQVGVNVSDYTVGRYILCLNQEVRFENKDSESGLQRNQSFCSFNLSKAPNEFVPAQALAAISESLDVWAPIVLACMAVLFIGLWVWAQQKYTELANGRVRLIFKTDLSDMLTLVRTIMSVSAVIFLVASLVAIGIAAYTYYNTGVVGKILVVIGIIVASILYLMAFFGYWAIFSRSAKMLLLNALVIVVPLGIGIWLLLTLNSLGKELAISSGWVADGLNNLANSTNTDSAGQPQQGGWMDKLEEFWIWLVANHVSWACSFQAMLECSGWYTTCVGSMGSTATCPPEETCLASGRYTNMCQKRVQDYIVSTYNYAVTCVAICVALLGGALLLDMLNYVLLTQEKKKVREEISRRMSEQKQKLGVVDKPGPAGGAGGGGGRGGAPGQPVDKFASMFLLRSLDKGNRAQLITEFKRIDVDNSGELSRGELGMFIYRALGHKPHPQEIEEVFAVADLDKNGKISLREFLLLFGWTMDEMDQAKTPVQKKGMLQRVTSFAARNSAGAAAGAAGAGAAYADAPPLPAPLQRRQSKLDMMTPMQVAQMREEMRRRAATRFEGINMFGPNGSPLPTPATHYEAPIKAPPMMVQSPTHSQVELQLQPAPPPQAAIMLPPPHHHQKDDFEL